ncbi:MAG: hypothetical protein H6739_04035 [Alphaproteobacteria bacterium]|nr:hypothetical protein [Alphaproteobacteria bacterium]
MTPPPSRLAGPAALGLAVLLVALMGPVADSVQPGQPAALVLTQPWLPAPGDPVLGVHGSGPALMILAAAALLGAVAAGGWRLAGAAVAFAAFALAPGGVQLALAWVALGALVPAGPWPARLAEDVLVLLAAAATAALPAGDGWLNPAQGVLQAPGAALALCAAAALRSIRVSWTRTAQAEGVPGLLLLASGPLLMLTVAERWLAPAPATFAAVAVLFAVVGVARGWEGATAALLMLPVVAMAPGELDTASWSFAVTLAAAGLCFGRGVPADLRALAPLALVGAWLSPLDLARGRCLEAVAGTAALPLSLVALALAGVALGRTRPPPLEARGSGWLWLVVGFTLAGLAFGPLRETLQAPFTPFWALPQRWNPLTGVAWLAASAGLVVGVRRRP